MSTGRTCVTKRDLHAKSTMADRLSRFFIVIAVTISSFLLKDAFSMSMPAAAAAARSIGKLHPSKTCLLLCDMQERFRPLIHHAQTVIHTTQYMTSVAKA